MKTVRQKIRLSVHVLPTVERVQHSLPPVRADDCKGSEFRCVLVAFELE